MRVPFRLVDVFTDRPLAGNQLCVVPEPVPASPELMQAIAREIGFSETTFVTEAGGDRYAMRIFMPRTELPFAGHPSLGTAFVLVSEGRVSSPVTQTVAAGDFTLWVDPDAGTARMRQGPPVFGPPFEDRTSLAQALGLDASDLHLDLPSMVVSTGLGPLIVAASAPEAVRRAVPSAAALEPLLQRAGTDGVYLFALDGDRHAAARLFAFGLGAGLGEDPATGSAAGPLGAYLAEHRATDPGRLTISQGLEMGRPSTLLVDVGWDEKGWTIEVGGGVRVVGAGQFDLPDDLR